MNQYALAAARRRKNNYLREASQPVATVVRLPLPLGGWNLRDSPQSMPVDDARLMDNLIPENACLRQAIHGDVGGASLSAVVGGHLVTNIYGFNPGTKPRFLLTTNSSDLVQMSASGTCNITTGGGNIPPDIGYSRVVNRRLYVSALSGSFAPISWAGSAAVDTVDLTASSTHTMGSKLEMIGPAVFKNRGYWWKNRSNPGPYVWYSSDSFGAITGDLHRFDFSNFADGTVLAVTSWSIDGGAGPDDYFVVMFDTGTVLVYQGIWPEDVDGWALVGRYRIPRPISPNAVTEIGGKIMVITEQDYILLPDALLNRGALITESKIAPRVRELAANKALRSSWQSKFFPNKGWLVIKAPLSTTDSELHCQTREGAWFRITFTSAMSMTEVDGRLLWLRTNPDPFVYELERRPMRAPADRIGNPAVKTAWSKLGFNGQKQVTGLRAQIWTSCSGADSFPDLNYALYSDFDETESTAVALGTQIGSAAASSSAISNAWLQASKSGRDLSVSVKPSGHTNSEVEIRGIDLLVAPLNEIA